MSNGKMSWYIKFLFSKDIKVNDLLRFFTDVTFCGIFLSFCLFVMKNTITLSRNKWKRYMKALVNLNTYWWWLVRRD